MSLGKNSLGMFLYELDPPGVSGECVEICEGVEGSLGERGWGGGSRQRGATP